MDGTHVAHVALMMKTHRYQSQKNGMGRFLFTVIAVEAVMHLKL